MSFVMLGTMIVLNLFIGVIVNSMDEAHAEQEAMDRKRHMDELGHLTEADTLLELERELTNLRAKVRSVRLGGVDETC